jgi:hypothetical protein
VQIHPDQAIVLGHQENGKWVDIYQFVIVPQADSTSRLILRTRTMMTGGIWTVIHPGVFIMERGLLYGVKQRAEQLSQAGNLALTESKGGSRLIFLTPRTQIDSNLLRAMPLAHKQKMATSLSIFSCSFS